MKVLQVDLEEYLPAQIQRSDAKWAVCNVTDGDVLRYRRLVGTPGRVLCLGVRNGMEVGLFQAIFGTAEGVEINPRCHRPDVVNCDFTALPTAWKERFDVLFSNSFQCTHDPFNTAMEWRRVVKPGGTLILAYTADEQPTKTEPVAALDDRWMRFLFGGRVLWTGTSEVGYSELALRKTTGVRR